ncbi:alpha/beta hydrolase [Candidatus Uabimicrobium amorphum]|nr:alpha/beta fold hydrolase [Candidatus Uabimicrobium amorphum]
MFFIVMLVIFNIWIFVFAIYEYSVSWGENTSWCTEEQLLKPEQDSRRCVVMVHGFGGSPFDFKPLASQLAKNGFLVRIPIMPGQTKDYLAYNRGKFTHAFFIKWLREIIKEEQERFGRKPYLIGFSMGATLSTVLAAEDGIDKLVLIAPFYSLPKYHNALVNFNKLFGFVLPVVPKLASGQLYSKEGRNTYIPGTFLVSSLAFRQLNFLASEAIDVAPKLSIPTLIVASRNDKVISFAKINELFSQHSNVTINEYPRSNHIMLYDYECDAIIADVVSFCNE